MTDVAGTTFQPPMPTAPAGLEIGKLWGLTFRTFRKAPWRFILLALLPFLFDMAATFLPVPFARRDTGTLAGVVSVLGFLAQLVVALVVQSAAIYAAARLMTTGDFTIGQAMRVGLRRFWPVLGLVLLLLPIIGIGYLFFIVPGIILGLVFAVAYQVCLLERRGPIEAMQRSAFLTRGNRLRIFATYLLFLLVPMVVFFGISMIVIGYLTAHPETNNGVAFFWLLFGFALMIPVWIVLSALLSILLAAIFVELRRLKEGGIGKEAIASVFD